MNQADWSMIRAIRVEQSRGVESRPEKVELKGIFILERIRVNESGEKEVDHHREISELCQERRAKRSEKIGSKSEKISAKQSKDISVLNIGAERT